MEKAKSIPKWLIKLSISLGIAFFVTLVTMEVFFALSSIKELELKQIDERFANRGEREIKKKSNVIILDLNNLTIQGILPPYNSLPLSRYLFAKVVKNLSEAGVKAIGIDVVMTSPDKWDEQNDSLLFYELRKAKNVVLAGKTEVTGQHEFQLRKEHQNYDNIFFEADSSIGIVRVISDNDGVIRRYVPMMYSEASDKYLPTFGFATLNKYFDLKNDEIITKNDNFFILNNIEIPKFDRTSMLINYYGPDNTFLHFNFLEVLDDKEFFTKDEKDLETEINTWDDPDIGLLKSGLFKGKIVLIGSTEPEDQDIKPISFSRGEKKGDNLMYGVEIHATAIQNIISKDFLTKESPLQEIALIFFFTFGSFYFSSFLKEQKTKRGGILELVNILFLGGSIFGLRELSFYLFNHFSIVLNVISPALALVIGYVGSTAYHFIAERKQKAVIKGMFSQYVNSTVVDELIADPDKMRLGGERKVLSIFFSDIAGFSTFSETKKPEELVLFLNEYLSEMTRIIFENKGTLDKYIGDAVMAFWGAPLPFEDHAYQTCKSALLMQKRLAELRAKWREEGQTEIEIRMGVNTGEVVVGNMGGSERFDYTVMGDAVNLASRLEGANKEYGTNLMLSEMTHDLVQNDFITRELDALVVKGKTQPVKVYELIAFKDEQLGQTSLDCLSLFNEGLVLYKTFQFKEAATKFAEAKNIKSNDHPSFVYLKRCMHFIEFPPPKDWDGVFRMTTK
ncbi:MAG: adenylate/guanylate cyclase domain-containing protein [Ignavibacteriaceae bacterium]|nr:adenylate/guanylate cyclase domain-containing protein [Ignavibacteriaceae bacterium]